MKNIVSIILLSMIFSSSIAQQGKTIENFSLVNAINKKEIALSDFQDKKAIAVIFTSNYCPYSKLYEDRIKELHQNYSEKGLQILLINPNNPKKSAIDSIDKMAEKANEHGYPFPYLADKDQKVGNQFGATKTPEVFLLVKRGSGFQIVYHGAIDDNPQVPQDVSNNYVKEAISSVLNDKTMVVSNQRPTGCVIKKN